MVESSTGPNDNKAVHTGAGPEGQQESNEDGEKENDGEKQSNEATGATSDSDSDGEKPPHPTQLLDKQRLAHLLTIRLSRRKPRLAACVLLAVAWVLTLGSAFVPWSTSQDGDALGLFVGEFKLSMSNITITESMEPWVLGLAQSTTVVSSVLSFAAGLVAVLRSTGSCADTRCTDRTVGAFLVIFAGLGELVVALGWAFVWAANVEVHDPVGLGCLLSALAGTIIVIAGLFLSGCCDSCCVALFGPEPGLAAAQREAEGKGLGMGTEGGADEEEIVFAECSVCYEISGRWRPYLNTHVCDYCMEHGKRVGTIPDEPERTDGDEEFEKKKMADFAENENEECRKCLEPGFRRRCCKEVVLHPPTQSCMPPSAHPTTDTSIYTDVHLMHVLWFTRTHAPTHTKALV